MTLPAWREDAPRPRPRPRPRKLGSTPPPSELGPSPANQLLRMLEEADIHGDPKARQPKKRPADLVKDRLPKKLAGWLLGWSCIAMVLSVGYLGIETLTPQPVQTVERPPLDFADLSSRHVMSSEGPALELTGLIRNAGEDAVEPDVVLQLAGNRVAIEEPLRLGAAMLPPGAERPFTVRVLLPEGTKTVRILPPYPTGDRMRTMPLVSPAWTAPAVTN